MLYLVLLTLISVAILVVGCLAAFAFIVFVVKRVDGGASDQSEETVPELTLDTTPDPPTLRESPKPAVQRKRPPRSPPPLRPRLFREVETTFPGIGAKAEQEEGTDDPDTVPSRSEPPAIRR